TDVGSGRYDFWRVSLDAVAAHPIGGLGQDNFAEYYVRRRRTGEEPAWTHSFEFRLLTHTGVVGTALFTLFLVGAMAAALPARRPRSPRRPPSPRRPVPPRRPPSPRRPPLPPGGGFARVARSSPSPGPWA